MEFVCECLLIGGGGIGDGRDAAEIGALARQCYARHVGRHAGNFGKLPDRFVEIALCRLPDLGKLIDHVDDHLPVGIGEIAIGEEEAVGINDAFSGRQDTCLRIGFGNRQIRIPDRPGVDAAILERGGGIRRRKIDLLDIFGLQARLA